MWVGVLYAAVTAKRYCRLWSLVNESSLGASIVFVTINSLISFDALDHLCVCVCELVSVCVSDMVILHPGVRDGPKDSACSILLVFISSPSLSLSVSILSFFHIAISSATIEGGPPSVQPFEADEDLSHTKPDLLPTTAQQPHPPKSHDDDNNNNHPSLLESSSYAATTKAPLEFLSMSISDSALLNLVTHRLSIMYDSSAALSLQSGEYENALFDADHSWTLENTNLSAILHRYVLLLSLRAPPYLLFCHLFVCLRELSFFSIC